jgi:hypothetical protein
MDVRTPFYSPNPFAGTSIPRRRHRAVPWPLLLALTMALAILAASR